MKEKAFSLTGDDFTVKTVSGVDICKCKGKLLSLSDKKGQSFVRSLSFRLFYRWKEGRRRGKGVYVVVLADHAW